MTKNKYYSKVEKFVVEAFEKAGNTHMIKHSLRTSFWIKKLNPDVDDSLLIAALSHDIERAFQDDRTKGRISGPEDKEYLSLHQKKGAEIISNYLKGIKADSKIIEKVYFFVSTHEEGGDEQQNLLMDADTISFFENNVDIFINKRVKEKGKETVRRKFDFMYKRIHSDMAREICTPLYEKAIKELECIR